VDRSSFRSTPTMEPGNGDTRWYRMFSQARHADAAPFDDYHAHAGY
jgi:hypothetical protein